MGINAEMLVVTTSKLSESEVRKISVRLCEAFGTDPFFLIRPANEYKWEERHALEIINKYEQNGPDIKPNINEQFIRVSLSGRYYGIGYERGNLPQIVAIADWLERNIPNSTILYGGDSSGVCAEPFDKAARETLLQHFAENGHTPYTGDLQGNERNPYIEDDGIKWPFCDFCQVHYRRFGYGASYGAFSCAGCGDSKETRDKGLTWQKREE